MSGLFAERGALASVICLDGRRRGRQHAFASVRPRAAGDEATGQPGGACRPANPYRCCVIWPGPAPRADPAYVRHSWVIRRLSIQHQIFIRLHPEQDAHLASRNDHLNW